ncbi:MAG TPA: hypothetical protein PK402_03220 [Tepidisphaeraceae bacterium]|nr:hypothetical protein [Tepidisphaeraceae bacterium]
MKSILFAVLGALFLTNAPQFTFAFASAAGAEKVEQESLESLIDQLEKLANRPAGEGEGNNDKSRISGEISSAPKFIRELREYVGKKNFKGARQRIYQFKSWAVRKDTIEMMVRLEEAMRAQETTVVTNAATGAEKTIQKVREAIARAKTKKELEPLREELLTWRNASELQSAGDIRGDVEEALRNLDIWSALLAAEESGNPNEIENAFRRINTNSLITPELVSAHQNEITARSAKKWQEIVSQVQSSLNNAKTSDDVAKVADSYRSAMLSYSSLAWPAISNRPESRGSDEELDRLRRFGIALSQMENGQYRASLANLESVLTQFRNPMRSDGKPLMMLDIKRFEQLINQLKAKIAIERETIDEPLLREWVAKLDAAGDTLAFLKVARDYASVSRSKLGGDSQGNSSYNFDNLTVANELRVLKIDLTWFDTGWGHLTNNQFGEFWNLISRSRGGDAMENYRWRDRMIAAREGLMREALINSNLLPADAFKDAAKSIHEAILAYVDQSVREKNWLAVRDGLDGYRLAFYGANAAPQWLSADLVAADAYVRAQRFEAANLPVDAVVHYLRALDAASQRIPAAIIAERLDAIRSADPNVIEAAKAQLASMPPAQTVQQPAPQPNPRNPTTQPR